MQLNKEKIVFVDICTTENREVDGHVETYEKVKNYNVICVKHEHGYIPVKYINGYVSYAKLTAREEYHDKFLACQDDKYLSSVPNGGGYYAKNVRPAFKEKGRVDIETLKLLNTFNSTDFNPSNGSEEQPAVERE